MLTALNALPPSTMGPFVRPGVILAEPEEGRVRVRLAFDERRIEANARIAAGGHRLRIGASVLVAGESLTECYVVGGLDAAPAETAPSSRVEASNGVAAQVVKAANGERIEVRDADANLVFEYDVESGRTVLSVPAGDLELRAPSGNIDLVAGKALRCRAEDEIALGAGTDRTEKDGHPGLRIDSRSADLKAETLRVAAARGEFAVADAVYAGRQLSAKLERAKVVLDRIETVARNIVGRARNVYQFVESLNQTKAGRMRTLVDGAYHLKGETVTAKAERTMKIDGEKINLG